MKFTTCLLLVAVATIATIVHAELASEDTNCNFACLAVMRPVYDDNGVMYPNDCAMKAAKCEENKKKKKSLRGGKGDSNSGESECSSTTGEDESKCPTICFDVYRPVTDEDGKTYSNECYMKREKCKGKKKDDGHVSDLLGDFKKKYGREAFSRELRNPTSKKSALTSSCLFVTLTGSSLRAQVGCMRGPGTRYR